MNNSALYRILEAHRKASNEAASHPNMRRSDYCDGQAHAFRFAFTALTSEDETLAAIFASAAHVDAGKRYGDFPYTYHLAAVRGVLEEFGFAHTTGAYVALMQAAWLHDTLEDTKTTYDDLVVNFGKRVADLVEAVTGRGPTRPVRNQDFYRKIRAFAGSHAGVLKVCDRIANVRQSAKDKKTNSAHILFDMYCGERAEFEAALNPVSIPVQLWEALDCAYES